MLPLTARQNVAHELQEASKNMAYVNTTRVARKGVVERFVMLKDFAATALNQRRVYGRTVAELNALSDRELADLGISRISIPGIAHEAAYGK
jgi:uncharacterized protein YjiS (DUF1127 family)